MNVLIKGISLDELGNMPMYEIINNLSLWFDEGRIVEIPTPLIAAPKGKWIEDTGLYATCSNCKENLYQAIEYKFCPNCGADMRGEE